MGKATRRRHPQDSSSGSGLQQNQQDWRLDSLQALLDPSQEVFGRFQAIRVGLGLAHTNKRPWSSKGLNQGFRGRA
ncbi:hypothetical protein [Cyanobium sp. A2C-AMD]|uniref:hypothetical protein n=1 Tax=Cyanobium sp. A2C-AMD TaxID=2823695 RepID=UPI0020CBB479|nr:hypothetical protein [Cyanobium sp. A2C-AMD]